MKAVFIDYTGTTMQERGPDIEEVIVRVCRHSTLHDPKTVMTLWYTRLRGYEERSYGEKYLTQDEIVDHLLHDLADELKLQDDLDALHTLIQRFWVNAPIFPDVRAFYEKCPLPLYVISNNAEKYVRQAMEKNDLHPAGLVCADAVHAYKPHRELFEEALARSGCRPEEAVHIGDSYSSDVLGARAAGIRPILVQRGDGETYPDVLCVRSLEEIDLKALADGTF